jgi:hypothetical protein
MADRMTATHQLGNQWLHAASRLDIECVAPYTLNCPDGRCFQFACLLPQFGSTKGMLLAATYDTAAARAAAELGHGYSCLDPHATEESDLDSYIDCLRDWRWAATGREPPFWYASI